MRKIFHSVGDPGSGVQARHRFLIEGESLEVCSRKLRLFFESYQLVRYGELVVSEEESVSGHAPEFWRLIEESEAKNRERVRSFLGELAGEGVTEIAQLEFLPQGYMSKTLHTVTHLLDGFFGIDSYFFSLPEGSHFISPDFKKKITAKPHAYMLLTIQATI